MLPPITILINAFGRTWILAEALESALRQEYQGAIEVLIVNDFQRQTLLAPPCWTPLRTVRVVNLPERMPTLGDKRNAGIELAAHDRILLADDDDIMLPWAAHDLMKRHMVSGLPTWADRYFYTEGYPPNWKCVLEQRASAQHGLITKHHWSSVGKFLPYSTRDDIDFLDRVVRQYGPQVVARVDRPGYLYRWGTNTYHLAGSSDCFTSWQNALRVADMSVDSGEEPAGDVPLTPRWKHDYLFALTAGGHL